MNPHNTPQPPPQPQTTDLHQSAHWLVCSDLMDRAALGQQKYGVPLMADNGRDHLTDAYQELLDLVAYLRCEMERRKNTPAMTLDGMATVLSFEGYLVYGPDDVMTERTWRRIGEKEGYLPTSAPVPAPHTLPVDEMRGILDACGYEVTPKASQEDDWDVALYQPPEPWPRVEDRAGLMQGRVPVEEARRPAETVRYQPEHADMPSTPPEMPQISHNGTGKGIDTPEQQEEAFSASTASPTVLQHCMASEQRQGKTVVRQDILEELLRHRIPYDGRWDDWSAEVARLCPGRWEV